MEIDELAIKITGDSTSLQSAMNEASESMGKLGINASTLTGLLGAGGLAAAFKAAYEAADKMVQAYRGDETALLKYNAALQASNSINAEGKKSLDNYVSVFASMSGIAEANTQSMIAMLAATGRNDEQIKTMMKTAQGMATVMGIDVNTALTQLNQTLSGTTGRLGMQTPALKDLTAEQLKNGEGIKILSEKYGQFSDTLAHSTDVSIKNYENAYSDLMSTMGASIAKAIQPARDALTSAMRAIINDGPAAKAILVSIGVVIAGIAAASLVAMAPLLAGLAAAAAAAAPVVAAIAAITAVIGGLTYQTLKNAEAQKQASADAIAGLTKQSDALEANRLKAITVAQDKAAAEKKAADDTAKAWAEAEKKIIEGRKTAQKQYEDTLAQIDTRVKLGIINEQDAADAKYAANQKLIDDLIALGYTGAAGSKSIGDQTLREAIARNNTLYTNTRENVDKRLLAEYELYLQQQDVAAWEKAYLAKKKASEEAFAEGQKRLINKRLETTEQVTAKEDAAEESLQKSITNGFSSTAQHAEQMAERRKKTVETTAQAITTLTEREAKAAEDAYIKAAEDTAKNLLKVQKNYIQARLTNTEYVTLAEEAAQAELDKKVSEGASSQAQHAEQMGQRRIATAQRTEQALITINSRETTAIVQKWEQSQKDSADFAERVHKDYVERRLQATENVIIQEDTLEANLQKKVTEGASSTAQHAEQVAERKLTTAKRTADAEINIFNRALADQQAAEEAAAKITEASREKITQRYVKGRLEATEQVTVAEEKAAEAADQRINKALQSQIALENGIKRYIRARLEKTEEVTQKEDTQESELAKKKNAYWASYSDYIAQKSKEIAEAEAAANKKREEDYKKTMAAIQAATEIGVKYGLDILKAYSDLVSAAAKQQTDAIDAHLKAQLAAYEAEKQAALEAAGLADKTTLETLQEKVDAAKAAGDAEALAAAEAALKKQQIIEEYNAKELAATKKAEYDKAVIKYKADIAQYGVNIAMAVAQGALAIIQAFAQLGPIAGAIAAAVVAATTAAQIVVMTNNKPQPPPALALGGVADGLTWVGERGAELVDLPAGSYVHDAEESKRIAAEMKAANQTFIFNSPIALTPAEMKRQFKLAQRRAAFMGAI